MIEPVYRKSSRGREETTPTLYGSGFKIELQKGVILRGEVTSDGLASKTKAAGISVALANHNSPDGMMGKRFKTDSEGRFEVTGLAKNWRVTNWHSPAPSLLPSASLGSGSGCCRCAR